MDRSAAEPRLRASAEADLDARPIGSAARIRELQRSGESKARAGGAERYRRLGAFDPSWTGSHGIHGRTKCANSHFSTAACVVDIEKA